MRCRILYIFLVFAASLWGCAEELRYGQPDIAEKGNSSEIFVKYTLAGLSVKASVDEFLIDDVNLYVANDRGDVVACDYCAGDTVLGRAGEGCRLGVDIQKNMKYAVYAVANAGRPVHIRDVAELESMVHVISGSDELINSSGSVLMAGLSSGLHLNDGQTVTVDLERCISKISVRADFSGLNEDVTVSISSIALKNIPDRVCLFGENRISEPGQALESAPICNLSSEMLKTGVVFYQYENLQGNLQPSNTDYTKKVWPSESLYSKICSYVELKGYYSSPRQRGDIVYRFYLGSDMTSNYDIMRNTGYNIVVNFNGDGAVGENTWRVDNTCICDLVTDISVMPKEHTFEGLGLAVQLQADVLPVTAANKGVKWSSSDPDIAVVDENGCVVSVSEGSCMIMAASIDGSGVCGSCAISVTDPKIAFEDEGRVMYDGEIVKIPYRILSPAGSEVVAKLSNDNAQIVDSDNTGVTVKALVPGNCAIIASIGNASDTCLLDIQKLSIKPVGESAVAYNHFYHDIKYAITPSHASGMEVGLSLDDELSEDVTLCGGARMLVSAENPQQYSGRLCGAKLFLKEREDVFADVEFSIKESWIGGNIRVVSNSGRDDAVKEIVVNTSPNAFESMEYTLRGVYGEHVEVGSLNDNVNFIFKYGESEVAIKSPCAVNGKYDLELLTIGDDKKIVRMNSVLEIYEAVWIAAVSKSISKEKISQVPFVVEYANELVLKAFATSGSLFYSEGEVDENLLQGIEYEYDGRHYSDTRPDFIQTHKFEFVKGAEYAAFPSGVWKSDGRTSPDCYMEFFDIDIVSPWINTPDGKLLYLRNRVFGNGFCENSASWKDIFRFVYPQ